MNTPTKHFLLSTKVWVCILAGLLANIANADLRVNSISGSLVTVHFDQLVNPGTAAETINYSIFSKGQSGGSSLIVTNAIVQSDQQTVALYLNGSVGEFFAVGVNGVTDTSNNVINTSATGVISDFSSALVGTNNDPSFAGDVVPYYRDTFLMSGSGSDIGGTSDHCQFAFQPVAGDFEMIAQIFRLDNTDSLAKGGLMAREDLNSSGRMIGIFCTPTNTVGSNIVQLLIRSTTGGIAFTNSIGVNGLRWLRITRTNTTFTAYYGTNGANWTTLGQFSGTFNNTDIGAAVTSRRVTANTTAGFASFGISGAKPGAGAVPVPSISIYQRTNLVVSWQRTPSDFCPQVAINLNPTNTSGASFSNATQWAYVLYPVFDTSLTGTNAAQPTPARYMIIPMNLFTNQQMFVRLARVDRLIPDPISVTPGIILSQASGSMTNTTPTSGTIGGTQIDTTTAVAQNGVPVLCPVGKNYQFTTATSGSSLQVCILVRNFPAAGSSTADGSFTAGSFKSQVTLAPASPNTGYTFVAAATAAVKPSACNPIQVEINIK
jgi:hypothetical protein